MNALTDYYQDAATFAGADHEAHGSCFFVVTMSDRKEFPELASAFGAQLTPAGGLILHPTRQSYIDAIVAAQNV